MNSDSKSKNKKAHPRSKFTSDEDDALKKLVNNYGTSDWEIDIENIKGRNARQCRDRWQNYLSPDVVNGPWSKEEEKLLLNKYEKIGPFWRQIAKFFPTRTDINIKSHWNLMERRLKKETLELKKNLMKNKHNYCEKNFNDIRTFMPSKRRNNSEQNSLMEKNNSVLKNDQLKESNFFVDEMFNDNDFWNSVLMKDDLVNNADFIFF